jgi:2-succinyl-5-enolpyruvyl-6-hydroxy-3-cyclohexene-1-carboxylate synthase
LPQATEVEEFEELFGTPHGLDFRPLAETYGARFSRVASWDEFRAAAGSGLAGEGLTIVEVPTERARNALLHRELWREVSAALARDRA